MINKHIEKSYITTDDLVFMYEEILNDYDELFYYAKIFNEINNETTSIKYPFTRSRVKKMIHMINYRKDLLETGKYLDDNNEYNYTSIYDYGQDKSKLDDSIIISSWIKNDEGKIIPKDENLIIEEVKMNEIRIKKEIADEVAEQESQGSCIISGGKSKKKTKRRSKRKSNRKKTKKRRKKINLLLLLFNYLLWILFIPFTNNFFH